MIPEQLRQYGHEQAHRAEWGDDPPLWLSAMAEADWEMEARIMEEEVHNTRDCAYSAWHRRGSIGRYVDEMTARRLAMIDLDAVLYIEYDDTTKAPLALIEVAVDVGQTHKPATVTRKLAERANLPAYTVLYKLSERRNPADRSSQDIVGFRVNRLCPFASNDWREFTPQGWADNLALLRKNQVKRSPRMMLQDQRSWREWLDCDEAAERMASVCAKRPDFKA